MHFHEGEPVDEAHGWITITIGLSPESSIGGSAINTLDVAKHQAYPLLEKRVSKYLLEQDALTNMSSCRVGLAVVNVNTEGEVDPTLTLLIAITLNDSTIVYHALKTNKPEIEGKIIQSLDSFPPERSDIRNLEQNGLNVVGISKFKKNIYSYSIWGKELQHLSESFDSMFANLQYFIEAAARPKTTSRSIITAILPREDTDKFYDNKEHTVFDIFN
jgi:hypothetical protein